ncbi:MULTISPECIES: PepSY-like domain-containing protein [Methylobacter]|jgi:Putative beta-lactamase-inhibitor-like, PepSY-like|uniref:PepSY-like domain-containing protein n=1 Tax=Methylobacter TaxID=429 RepID=UPI0003703CA3|nr:MULTISPECIES: hypothetical protein [Methylobacter]
MRKYLLNLGFLVLAMPAFAVGAAVVAKEAIPEKIMARIHEQHPNAADIEAERKTHFGQAVYEIHFKDGESDLIELYRENGHFYVSGEKIDAMNLMPEAVDANLKAEFTTFEIKEAILIVNPNGPGEEYDLTVVSNNQEWSLTIDGKGNIIKKERN